VGTSGTARPNPPTIPESTLVPKDKLKVQTPAFIPIDEIKTKVKDSNPQLPIPFTFSQQLEQQMKKNHDSTSKILTPKQESKELPPGMKKVTVKYEVLHNGQLVIVDGIHFFVRSTVAFMDCPMCTCKSMSMSLLPDHLRDDHHLEYIQCPADKDLCGQVVPWHKILQHIVTHHGRLPCEFCSRVCMVNEMHNHMTKECSASYYHLPKGSNETIQQETRKFTTNADSRIQTLDKLVAGKNSPNAAAEEVKPKMSSVS